jgi:hypothetical protein
MSYRLPPLNGLRAFEAAGRHLSFKAAATELSVTPGAASQQVKHLEQALGVPLFQRLHRSLILTAQGEALLPEVADAFERLSKASDTVAKALKTKPLRLGISPALSDEPDRLLARLAGTKRPPIMCGRWRPTMWPIFSPAASMPCSARAPAPIPACMPKCWRPRPASEPTRRPRWWSGPASRASSRGSPKLRIACSWFSTERPPRTSTACHR